MNATATKEWAPAPEAPKRLDIEQFIKERNAAASSSSNPIQADAAHVNQARVEEGADPLPCEFSEDEIRRMQELQDGCTRADAIELLREREAKSGPFKYASAAPVVSKQLPPPVQVIAELVDAGDKCFIIGSSKARKSFYALQTSLHIASGGRAGMPFEIPEKRRVLFFNLEIQAGHFERRVQRMAKRLSLSGEDIALLMIANLRGEQITEERIIATVKKAQADVVVLDPAYKLHGWDEKDVTPWLAAFDRIVQTGATLIIVHHEKKGVAGDRQGVDRGSGDGRMQRDYDAALLLAAQRDEPGAVVMSQVQRNYPPQDACVLRFDLGAFIIADDLPPIEETSQSQRNRAQSVNLTLEDVENVVKECGPIGKQELQDKLMAKGATRRASESLINDAVQRPDIDVLRIDERKPGGRKLHMTCAQKMEVQAS